MRFFSYFPRRNGFRSGTTKVNELQDELRDNGFTRQKTPDANEYQYQWVHDDYPIVHVNYRCNWGRANSSAYAWINDDRARR